MSIPCGKSELLLFDPGYTQVSTERASWADIFPANSPTDGGPIQFNISPSNDCYLDLNDTMLYLKCSITPVDKLKKPAADECAPVNLLLSSLFSDVEVKLGEKVVFGGNHMYNYMSFISTLLNVDDNVKRTQLRAAGFLKDEAGKLDDKTNSAHRERSKWISQPFEVCGALNLPFFQQGRYVLPKLPVHLKFTRAKQEFCLMNFSATGAVQLVIETAVLYVRRVYVQPSILKAHEDGLQHHNAIYPLQRPDITNYTIGKGAQSDSRQILISSEKPKLLVVALVDNEAFNGTYKRSPFNFQHFDITYLSLTKDGEPIPAPPLQPDFENNIYMREYLSMVQNMELFNTRTESNGILPRDFANGSTLFVFNLTPDLCMQDQHQFSTANLRLDMKFARALPRTINVLVYSMHDSLIEITADRQVLIS